MNYYSVPMIDEYELEAKMKELDCYNEFVFDLAFACDCENGSFVKLDCSKKAVDKLLAQINDYFEDHPEEVDNVTKDSLVSAWLDEVKIMSHIRTFGPDLEEDFVLVHCYWQL